MPKAKVVTFANVASVKYDVASVSSSIKGLLSSNILEAIRRVLNS